MGTRGLRFFQALPPLLAAGARIGRRLYPVLIVTSWPLAQRVVPNDILVCDRAGGHFVTAAQLVAALGHDQGRNPTLSGFRPNQYFKVPFAIVWRASFR
jgi:hypothetical protein